MHTVTIIDPAIDLRWDQFVNKHPFGHVCHSSAWKQILEESYNHIRGYCFVGTDENGHIKSAIPIYLVKSWLTGKRLVSVPFATLCDPLVSTAEELQTLMSPICELAGKNATQKIEIAAYHSKNLSLFNRFGLVNTHITHQIDLFDSFDIVYKRFHPSTKYCLKRAKRENFNITTSISNFDDFYELYLHTRRRLCLPSQPARFFRKMIEYLGPLNKLSLIMAYKQSAPVAGLVCFKHGPRFSAEFSGWDRSYSKGCANYQVWWEAIQIAKNEGYNLFDFGRTSLANIGLLNFKDKWGTTRDWVSLYRVNYTASEREKPQRERTLAFTAAQQICKVLPEIVYKHFSNFCYNHLGGKG